jgi:uncharacterized protein with FMN-binding domain
MHNATNPTRQYDATTIARLERLAARRASSSPVDPQTDGSAAKSAPRRRAHPSKKSRVAALGLSLATTGGLTYTFAASASTAEATSAATAAAGVVTTSATAATTTAATATATAAPTTTATPAATTTAVNGAVYTNKYGAVQVQAVFAADGSLSAVNVLQLPTDNKSVNINNRAVPVLNSEALAAQSAKVHTVSGATYTTNDYIKSLQSAIDIARAAGITKLV